MDKLTNNQTIDPQVSTFKLALDSLKPEPSTQSGFSDGSRPRAEHTPTTYDEQVWRLGWADGRVSGTNSRDDSKGFFENQATIWIADREVKLAAEKAEREVERQSLKESHQSAIAALERIKRLNDEVASHSLRHNPKFSMVASIAFLVAGLLLWFADLPLTAQLAVKSLGFPGSYCVDITGSARATDRACSNAERRVELVGQVFSIDAVRYFWDVFVLAIALGGCSFLVKAFLDALLVHQRSYDEESKRVDRLRMVAMGSAVGVFLLTLIALGFVRNGVFTAETQMERENAKLYEERRKTLEKTANPPPDLNKQLDDLKRYQREAELRAQARSSDWVKLGFILLTLLFPIASGALLHLSARYFHHWNIARNENSDLRTAEDRVREAADEVLKVEGALSATEIILERFKSQRNEIVAALAQQWNSLYLHGRDRGEKARSTMDSSDSIYSRALYTVQRNLG